MRTALIALGVGVAVGLGAGVVVGWKAKKQAPPELEVVTVTKEVFRELEPRTEIRWRDRIVTKEVPVVQTVIAEGAGVEDVDTFCGSAGFVPADSIAPVEPSQMCGYGAKYDGDQLLTFWFDNAGNKRRLENRDVDPPWEFRADGLELTVFSSRWHDVKVALQYGGAFAGGAGAGYLACKFIE